MSLLHDAYTALISGLTRRTGKEIHWYDKYGRQITVEPIDVERENYVVRQYDENGVLWDEAHYLKDQLHGKSTEWYPNGQKWLEECWKNGQRHGKEILYSEDGQKRREQRWEHNKLVEKIWYSIR